MLNARSRLLGPVNQRIRTLVYALSPHRAARWVGLAVLVVLYALWVWVRPGWYIVTYGLGIYVLNLTVSFVSPVEDLGAADGRPLLPVTVSAAPLQRLSARRVLL